MKRILAVLLSCAMVLTGCTVKSNDKTSSEQVEVSTIIENTTLPEEIVASIDEQLTTAQNAQIDTVSQITYDTNSEEYINSLGFSSLNDPNLMRYVEDTVYSDLVNQLNSDDYFVENVEAIYISKEYLDELAYNSQENIYFGYKLSELDEAFQGQKYIFTLGDNGQTDVQPFEEYDDTFDKVIRNVAIGTGVILLCVTVSVVTGGLGAPAASMIFAASAKSATVFALSSGVISGVSAGVVEGVQTHDFDKAVKAAALKGSEGFMWGAISGAVIGGVSEGTSLYGAAKQTEFTMNQYAQIQHETGYPLDVIKEFHSMDEYQVFRDANLKSTMVGNKSALIKNDIDLTRIDSKGRTNLQRMQQGLAPQDSNGISYELHHVGQKKDGTLAILSQSEHDNPAIHGFLERTEAHAAGNNWDTERQAFWKVFASMIG